MIPKIIHQIWLGPKPRPVRCMSTWQQRHPDWEYWLWTEANLPSLRNQAFYDAFCKAYPDERYDGRTDLIRYEILHSHGGFYADADTQCLKPIDDLLVEAPFDSFGCWESEVARPGMIANTYLGVSRGNELMQLCVEEAEARFNHFGPDLVHELPWKTTGPLLVTEIIEGFNYNRFKIYPSWTLMPVHGTGVTNNHGEPYAVHLWGTHRAYGVPPLD